MCASGLRCSQGPTCASPAVPGSLLLLTHPLAGFSAGLTACPVRALPVNGEHVTTGLLSAVSHAESTSEPWSSLPGGDSAAVSLALLGAPRGTKPSAQLLVTQPLWPWGAPSLALGPLAAWHEAVGSCPRGELQATAPLWCPGAVVTFPAASGRKARGGCDGDPAAGRAPTAASLLPYPCR